MRRRAVLAAFAAAACGSTQAPTATGDVLAQTPTGAGEVLDIGIPQPLVEIDLIVRDVVGLDLFADEQLAAAEIIAAWAPSVGLRVAKPSSTRELLSRAAAGQHALTGKRCGAPLWSLAAVERWHDAFAAEGRIEAAVMCGDSCILGVAVSEGLDAAALDAGRTALWTAPFDRTQPWRDELKRRLGELAPREITPLVSSTREEPLPDAAQTSVRTCLGDVGAIGLLVETDATGAVTRCEGHALRIVGNAPVATCACTALVGTSVGGTARRFSTSITRTAVPLKTKAGKQLDAHVEPLYKRDAGTGLQLPVVSTRAVRYWEPPPPWAIAACFVDLAATAKPLRAELLVTASGDGVPRNVALADANALTKPQRECVLEAFARATKVPCPDAAEVTMAAVLVVEQR